MRTTKRRGQPTLKKAASRWLLLPLGVLSILFGFTADLFAASEEAPLAPGTYRLEMRMATTTRLPIAGVVSSSSVSVSLVDVRREGPHWIQHHRVCDFRSGENTAMVRMFFPERFIASLARPTYSIQFTRDSAGWRYQADLGLEHIGYKPSHADGTLPAAADHPAVFDWDGDGRPGATLMLSIPFFPNGELYVVQRGRSVLRGRIVEPGRVEGRIDVRVFEQRVVGARPGVFNYTPEIVPDSDASRFFLTPVAPGSSCQALVAAGQALAEGEPAP